MIVQKLSNFKPVGKIHRTPEDSSTTFCSKQIMPFYELEEHEWERRQYQQCRKCRNQWLKTKESTEPPARTEG